jgi:hypothetical protein
VRAVAAVKSFAQRMASRSFERRSQPTLDIFLRRKRHGRNRVHWRACWIVNGNGDIAGRLRPRRTSRQSRRRLHLAIASAVRREHTEGQIAKSIESQTAKLPSDTFFWAAVASIGVSATLQMVGKQSASVFVGQWAPTLLTLGLYNKLVKQHGSDVTDTGA